MMWEAQGKKLLPAKSLFTKKQINDMVWNVHL